MLFAPIHICSGYSFLKSGLTVSKIVESVKANDYFGASITDDGSLFALPEFVEKIEKINKPFIVGVEFHIENEIVAIYATDEQSYLLLAKLSTTYQRGALSIDDFKNSKGLIGVIATKYGSFYETFQSVNQEDVSFNKSLNRLAKCFDGFYLGIEVTSKQDVSYANKVRKFANAHEYECVAFPNIKYQKKNDAIILDIVNAIANNEKIDVKSKSGQDYFLKEEDYQKILTCHH